MKHEAPQFLLNACIGGLLTGSLNSDHSARGKGRLGKCSRSLHRSDRTVDAEERRAVRSRDLGNVRTSPEKRSSHLGRLHRRTDLQGSKCRSLLAAWRCWKRSSPLLSIPRTKLTLRSSWLFALLFVLTAVVAQAQPYGQTPGDLLDQYRALRPTWFAAVTTAANRLFGILALIEFAWSAAILLMERTDLQGWTAGLIKRMMFVGAFYALLVNGPTWIPAIIDSFQIVGKNAAGVPSGLSPGDVFIRGLDIASSLGSTASRSGFFTNPAGAFALVLAALMIFLSFVVVSVHFIMAMVESYVVVGAGFLFLGFGGSRWTAPYVERFIALAAAVGVKIMVLYLLIGGGISLSAGWVTRASVIASSPNPLLGALDIVGGSIVFMALCWQAPKLTASVLGGAPAFSGGDIAGIGLAGVQTAFIVGSLGAGATRLLSGAGSAAIGAMSASQAASMGTSGSSPNGGGSLGLDGGSGKPNSSGGGSAGGQGGASGGNHVGSNSKDQPAPPTQKSGGTHGKTGASSSASGEKVSFSQNSPASPPSHEAPIDPAHVSPPQSSRRTEDIAKQVEGELDRAAHRAGMLRQALPPDGNAGAPPNLNLNSNEE